MKRLKSSKHSLKVRNDIGKWILFWIIALGLVFFLLVVPCTVAYGVCTDRLDIETLEPVSAPEKFQNEKRICR